MQILSPKQLVSPMLTAGFIKQPGETMWEITGRVLDEEGKTFSHRYIVPNLSGAVAPEKALHFHHNRARNALTQAMIEYKYPE